MVVIISYLDFCSMVSKVLLAVVWNTKEAERKKKKEGTVYVQVGKRKLCKREVWGRGWKKVFLV